MKFDTDPSVTKILATGILIFWEAFFMALLVISETGDLPSETQWIVIIAASGLACVTHFLTFLRGEASG